MTKRYVLTFQPSVVDEPITYTLIKKYDIKVNILNAYISSGETGKLAVEMEANDNQITQGLEYLKQFNIDIEPLDKKIAFRKEQCIHCGSCTAVCFPGALTMNKQTWELQFDANKCVICELCTTACPLKLFAIDFVD